MNHLMACRVCFAYDTRLHSISSGQLRDIYEKFTETSLETGDTKPTCVCFICFNLLKKFQKFIEKAKKTNQLLEEMLNFGLELSVKSLELFRKQQTGIPWTLGKTPTVRVISTVEDMEIPIKTEYEDSEMNVEDQNEDDLDGIPLEDTNQDTASDSEDDMPLQCISKQWKADCLSIESNVRLKRSNVSAIKTSKILKPDAREIVLPKKGQPQQMLERSKSLNYQNSPFKRDLCYKEFVDTQAFKNHQEKHEVLHSPKKHKSTNNTEKEILKSQAPLKRPDKSDENKTQNEDDRTKPDFKIRSKTFKTTIKTIIPSNVTTSSNINRDIKNSKIEANSNEPVTALNNIFICDVCKKQYLCKSLLESHIKKWHIIDPNINYQNYENANLLKVRDELKNNIIVTEKKISKKNKHKNYKCSYCSKSFNDGGNFARHVRIHTGEKPYKCSYCMKCFTQSSDLAKHVRTHTGENPYKCSYCMKCFTQSNDLAKHLRIHTGEKPYKCSYCTKSFTQSSSLTVHVRIHTGEKPYKCSYCTKCFNQSGDLTAHVRTHTGEKPYKCSYCTKCFIKSCKLATHVRIHINKKPSKC